MIRGISSPTLHPIVVFSLLGWRARCGDRLRNPISYLERRLDRNALSETSFVYRLRPFLIRSDKLEWDGLGEEALFVVRRKVADHVDPLLKSLSF